MSRKKKDSSLPLETMIDVVITKGDKCKIDKMTYGQWLSLKHHPGFLYQAFQPGYHGYKQNL